MDKQRLLQRLRQELAPAQWTTPGQLASWLDPRIVQTPMLDLLDEHLIAVAEGRIKRLIWTCSPQEGKSKRISEVFPLWMLLRNPQSRNAIASYEAGIARRWGRAVRNDILAHPELGLDIRKDTSAAAEWQLEGHDGGVVTVGIGGALTGRPVDGVLVIDDPLKGHAEADSSVFRQACVDWWQGTAVPRLGPGTPVILVMTRWHEDDLAGWLQRNEPGVWTTVNIPALADHDAVTGSDPLGRRPGEWMVSARGRSPEDWEQTRASVGSRSFNALYQGRPSPAEGGVFKRGWWRFFGPGRVRQSTTSGAWRVDSATEVIQSWDMAFKDTDGSDFVVGQVWARVGRQVLLVDQVRGRMDFPATRSAVRALSAKWPQAHRKLVEDKANGSAIIAELRRDLNGLVPVTPKESKLARANAVSAFVEAGDVLLPQPESAPWVHDFIEECAAFPTGVHDDQVDAMSQALNRLLSQASLTRFMEQASGSDKPPAGDELTRFFRHLKVVS